MSRMKLLAPLLATLLSVALAGCYGGLGDLEQYVGDVKKRKTTKIEPIPQMKPYQAFAYVSDDRRDPFLPTAPTHAGTGSDNVRPDVNRNREPLEEFPLDALKMVGIIQFNGRTYAMVSAPDGVVHRVTAGDHLGQNYGKIEKIDATEISLTEIIPDGFGGWVERSAVLAQAE